ncbi:MAG: hypothetical protein NDP19_04155 [Crenarchaeota archaeon]|nr:hypothetical protein [Thermoproteota archaeon]
MKGSIASLNDLGGIMSVVMLSEENIAKIKEARPIIHAVVTAKPEVKELGKNRGLT